MSETVQSRPESIDGIAFVPDPSRSQLNHKQYLDYRQHREDMIKWCLSVGKHPERAEGYATDTIRVRAGHIDRFYRWTWEDLGRYTTSIDHGDTEDYQQQLAYDDSHSATAKANIQKALKMLWKWRHYQFGEEQWDPEISFGSSSSTTNPREFFTIEERRRLREAVLDMDSIPHYKSVSAEERRRWKQYLAQCLHKPMGEITPADWEEVRGWKFPSLIHTSLDAGLRPIEVERATVEWVDVANNCLRIPKDESSKGENNWVVALKPQTAEILQQWLAERENYPKYDETNALWLTRESNPYSSSSLKKLLLRVCDRAGIDTKSRDISWYAIRHSVGTYMSRAEGLQAARSQLRHVSTATTMKYDQAPLEERTSALDKMG